MNWCHLPMGGGIYNQHPKFLDDMVVIMNIEAKVEKQKQQREMRKNKPSPISGGRTRRR